MAAFDMSSMIKELPKATKSLEKVYPIKRTIGVSDDSTIKEEKYNRLYQVPNGAKILHKVSYQKGNVTVPLKT